MDKEEGVPSYIYVHVSLTAVPGNTAWLLAGELIAPVGPNSDSIPTI